MATPGSGALAHIGWGREATYGTIVARTKFAEIFRENVKNNIERRDSEITRLVSPRRWFEAKKFVTGDLELPLFYEGYELLWQNLFGGFVFTALAAPATQHQFNPTDAILAGLSIEVERDIQAFLYDGCKLARAVVRAEVGREPRVIFSIVGMEETLVSMTTPTFPPEQPILHTHLQAQIDAGAFDVISFEITYDDQISLDRQKLGASTLKSHMRSDHRSCSGTVEIEFEDMVQYNRYTAGSEHALKLLATGGAIGASGVNYTWEWTMTRCVFQGETPEVPGAGPLRLRLPFRAYASTSGATEICSLIVKNQSATI